MKYYAGIGSRETPVEVCELFKNVAKYLASKDYILRSGHADGADIAFETGCDSVNGEKEIWLPWKGFNNSESKFIGDSPDALELASIFHPSWPYLKQGAQKLHSRNCNQVLGKDLKTPCVFIICWTKGGKGSGGTGQAIRVANAYKISIFDAGKYQDVEEIRRELKIFLGLA